MKLMPLKTSLLALALFAPAGPGLATAAGKAEPGTMVVAQAADDNAGGSQRIDAIKKFLAGGRKLSKLDDDKLAKRLKRAEKFQGTPGLPADLAQGLKQEIAELNDEMGRRKSGAKSADKPADKSAAKSADKSAEPDGGQKMAQAGGTADSAEVTNFLSSVRPASELDKKALRAQMRKAAQLSKSEGLSTGDRQKLRQVVRDARAALGTGGNASATTGTTATGDQQQPGQKPAKKAEKNASTGQTSPEATKGNIDVASEQKARDLINGGAGAKTMSKDDLRKRLAAMRDLLSTNKLSPETNKALRGRLATERTYLRQEVGKETGGKNGSTTNININTNVTINNDVVKVVISDRRPSADLKDDELRVRINVYNKIVVSTSYSENERRQWRAVMERDRLILRQRLLDARRLRAAKLKAGGNNFKIVLGVVFTPDRPVPPRSVFAAEVDDQEITEVLAAPPRRKLARKYTVDEVETDPQLRDAVARIEIDNVHFGFGEGFLREEEIDNLDRIAEIMEKILAVNPGEIFMIEGHTDAVGSDETNLQLSRERSKAVKEALTTYYVIPPENLKAVGFGERYLKIPTPEAEAENRRVSIARITALVGGLDQ